MVLGVPALCLAHRLFPEAFALGRFAFLFEALLFGESCPELDFLEELRKPDLQLMLFAVSSGGLAVLPAVGEVDREPLARMLVVGRDAEPCLPRGAALLGGSRRMRGPVNLL